MLLERGVVVSYETIRCWAKKFGPDYGGRLRRKAPSPNDGWHLDEVVVTIGGRKYWLRRAVDQDGYVLGEIVQARRNTNAAKRVLVGLMKKQGCRPQCIVTEKLRSYGAARRQIMPNVEHRSHKGLNYRAENSHPPPRKRERVMQRFRSPGALTRFASVFFTVGNLFVPAHLNHSAIEVHLQRPAPAASSPIPRDLPTL